MRSESPMIYNIVCTLLKQPLAILCNKIAFREHAIIISYELQYELHIFVALSFLSSHWRSGNIMPRIPTTVGSVKL